MRDADINDAIGTWTLYSTYYGAYVFNNWDDIKYRLSYYSLFVEQHYKDD